MKKSSILLIGCTFVLFSSCAPKISTAISKSYATLDFREEVNVLGLAEDVPANSEELGVIKIGDTGFSTNCDWDVVIDKAKTEARKVGGNAIKITEHIPPSVFGSSCHRITAKILKVDSTENIARSFSVDSTLLDADYALLHVYRHSGAGALVGYDLYLGDTVICRVSNNWKKTIKIKKDGLNTLWAKTEVKKEIPVNIKFGNEYYIRCSVTMGAFVGQPKIEIVDNQTGKAEYQSIRLKKKDVRDTVVLNDGREIECVVTGEDSENVYFTIFNNRKEIKTQVDKAQIQQIQKGNNQ